MIIKPIISKMSKNFLPRNDVAISSLGVLNNWVESFIYNYLFSTEYVSKSTRSYSTSCFASKS